MTELDLAARDLRAYAFAAPWSPAAMLPPSEDHRRDLVVDGIALRLQMTYTFEADVLHLSFSDRSGMRLPEEIVNRVLRALFLPEERPIQIDSSGLAHAIHFIVRCPLRA
jgi:hypothetical protein